jgi:hypothetical protein
MGRRFFGSGALAITTGWVYLLALGAGYLWEASTKRLFSGVSIFGAHGAPARRSSAASWVAGEVVSSTVKAEMIAGLGDLKSILKPVQHRFLVLASGAAEAPKAL